MQVGLDHSTYLTEGSDNPALEHRTESAYQPPPLTENLESVGRSTVHRCLVPAFRNASLPADLKAPRKLANYTADMDPTVWMESYELSMDLLRASDGVSLATSQ